MSDLWTASVKQRSAQRPPTGCASAHARGPRDQRAIVFLTMAYNAAGAGTFGTMTASKLCLSEAELVQLLKDPEAFARRAEGVISTMVDKLHRVEAEREAQKIEWERLFNQLERSQVSLREEHERSTAENARMTADRQSIIDARDAALAEVANVKSELRAATVEAARAKDVEREGADPIDTAAADLAATLPRPLQHTF